MIVSSSNSGGFSTPNSVPVSTAPVGPLPPNQKLSLAGLMTAGYGVGESSLWSRRSNPPPHRGTYGGDPKWAPLRVGVLRNTASSQIALWSLYFIFNPSQITVNFATNTGQIPANYYGYASSAGSGGANIVKVPNLVSGQSVSWSLIFDRTYDLMYNNDDGTNRGVLDDIAALYNVMGAFTQGADGSAIPLSTPCEVIFGRNKKGGNYWGFSGFISSVAITYGIMRANMIPSRCEVDLSMTTTYVPLQVAPASGSVIAPARISHGLRV